MDFWLQLSQSPSSLEGRAARKGLRKLPAVLPSCGSSRREVFREPEAAGAGLLCALAGRELAQGRVPRSV